jgi:putative multiple sugar transport system ATP-binding protein
MKVLSGVYPHGSYDGEIIFEGEERKFASIRDSEDTGIIIIHQELALVPLLSIAENIFLGNETAKHGVIDWFEAFTRTQGAAAKVGLKRTPQHADHQHRHRQAAAGRDRQGAGQEVKLLILDEPTASLNETDSQALLDLLLEEFKAQGITSILITHKLNEVMKSPTASPSCATAPRSIRWTSDRRGERGPHHQGMVGRELTDRYPAAPRRKSARRCLEVKNWNVFHPLHADRQMIKNVSLHVRGRGRRHRRPDGRGPHRTRHERSSAAPMARRSAARC